MRSPRHATAAALGLGILGSLALAACGTTAPSTTSTTPTSPNTTLAPTTTAGNTGAGTSGAGATTTTVAPTAAHVTSATVTGTVGAPVITVNGTGFGAQPAAGPVPQGQQGCPSAPSAGDGHLYGGVNLYFTDTHAKAGSYKNWNGGQYTPGNNGQFDCVGEVISSWSPTHVVFSFGNLYDKNIPQNYYVLSNGDGFQVFVKGASFKGTAKLSA